MIQTHSLLILSLLLTITDAGLNYLKKKSNNLCFEEVFWVTVCCF